MAGLVSLISAEVAGQNIVFDGGFELGLTSGPGTFVQNRASCGAWATVGNPALLGMPYSGLPQYEKAEAMHIGNSGQPGGVEQGVPTVKGQGYRVSLAAIGWNGAGGSIQIKAFTDDLVGLDKTFDIPPGNVWTTLNAEFPANGDITYLRIVNVTGACTIDFVQVRAAAAEVELGFTDRYLLGWQSSGTAATKNGSFWIPRIPSGQGFEALAHAGGNGLATPASNMKVGRAARADVFARPIGFTRVWPPGTGGANDAFWNPVPPPGYVALGTILAFGPPDSNSVMCVRSDLVVPGTVGDLIWDDAGISAGSTLSAWKIEAPPGGVTVGGFLGVQGRTKPTAPVYCLRESALITPAPTPAALEQMLATFGPIIRFDPGESYFPDDPAVLLDGPDTILQWSTVQNETSWSSLKITNYAAVDTSARTILDDVQYPLSHPAAEDSGFRYYLDFPQKLAGNLGRAKIFVRVQPMEGGILTDLQFWIFYPWNSAGKIHASCADIDYDPTGPVGQHWSDWENVRVRVTDKNVWEPGIQSLVNLYLSRHDFSEIVEASEPRLQKVSGHPVVYAARGSHAHYVTAGRNYYKTVGSKDVFFCTVYATLYDLCGNGQEMHTYLPANRIVVSSAWPGIPTTTPDWLFFGGNWGNYERQQFTVSDSGIEIYTFRQVEHGKPGLIRRWDVARPENANLGSLRVSAGSLSPTFNPQVTSYSMTVPEGVSQIQLTPQAADHQADVFVQINGNRMPIGKGPLLGKISDPIPLAPGYNEIIITVHALLNGAVTAEKTYTLTVVRGVPTVVMNANDSGLGSLRRTIADAPPNSVITFADTLSGATITLGGTQLLIQKNLTIDASTLPGGVTVSGHDASRVFEIGIDPGTGQGANVALKSLTITGGRAQAAGSVGTLGGGILVNLGLTPATLTLWQCQVVGNHAAGAGGGIYNNSGNISIEGCTIAGNDVDGNGGGLAIDGGSNVISHSAVFGNHAAARGGAIYNLDGTLTAINCTIADNSAVDIGGGLDNEGGFVGDNQVMTLIHCTVSGNRSQSYGSGLSNFRILNLENSVIAGNVPSANGVPDLYNASGTIHVSGNNLIGNNATIFALFPAGPLVGTPQNPLDPKLAPLDSYGGPTKTMPPLPGSPLIENAVLLGSTPGVDQRGAARPAGPLPDLGAVEAFPFSELSLIDTDQDGIDDRLEPAYGLVVGVDDRAMDSDGDGSSDAEEIQNMTDPKDPSDSLRIVSLVRGVDGDPSMVGRWVAEDWTGGTAGWVDRIGGRIATLAGPANSPTRATGVFPARGPSASAGLIFDGTNDYFQVSAAQNPIAGRTSVTIAAYFLATKGASGADSYFWQYPGPLNGESPGSPNDWGLTYDEAGHANGFFNSPITPNPAVSVIDGQPHTLILTWKHPGVFPGEGVARLYVDGNGVGETTPTGAANPGIVDNGFVIGAEPEVLGHFFGGAIGELRFYDSVQDPAALHGQLVAPQPEETPVYDLTFRSFPGLRYELETSHEPTRFGGMAGTEVVATGHLQKVQVPQTAATGFYRVRRGHHVRWAARVLAVSSQFTPDAWSAAQALGEPDTYPEYGDRITAWASESPDEAREYLELGYDDPAPISYVSIYETYAPGAVDKISVRNAHDGSWVEVWSGAASPAGDQSRVFTVTFPLTGFPVDGVRLELDSAAVPDWNEIDAVALR